MAASCRNCDAPLRHVFVDLGMSPSSNRYLAASELNRGEPFFPLKSWVCDQCLLVQLEQFEMPEALFQDYHYFSSYSESWLTHCRHYVEMISERLKLDEHKLVVELASNDGYLLQYFRARGVPCLGIEPAANVAEVARDKGIDTIAEFFGVRLAERLAHEGCMADLLLGNNVLAHVPDLHDFVAGMRKILKPAGVITMEFPHLLRLMQHNQFDTIYHEHFSYFSLLTARRVFNRHALHIFDVEELPTHGGSLRIYACHDDCKEYPDTPALRELLATEQKFGLGCLATYQRFDEGVMRCKRELLKFLIRLREEGTRVAGYGAPAKGNTLLNYCGIREDLLPYTVDLSPHKQGKFLPGTHIPVHAPEKLYEDRPEVILILPWNLKDEIVRQLAPAREWGCRFAVPIPQVQVLP